MSSLNSDALNLIKQEKKMGVIHKLREDVVSFIITLKKNNPSIGVRQLANLTSEQFHIQVSKSSVNSVLKKANLSSSVGRRSGEHLRPEKFSIPKIKKEQISKILKATGFLKEEAQAEKDSVLPEKKQEPFIEASQVEEEKKGIAVLTVSKEKSLGEGSLSEESAAAPDMTGHQKFLARVQTIRKEKEYQRGSLSEGVGFVFLKAAQWDIAERSLIGELFVKYIKSRVLQSFDSVSDMFLFFKFLGAEEFEHILGYRDHGIWALSDFCQTKASESKELSMLQELFQWNKKIQNSPSLENLVMEYNRMKDQAFLEVKGFKLLLEDKSEFAMDASMFSFGGGGEIPAFSNSSLPIRKAMVRLSNSLISNIQSAVFHRAPGETRLDRAFYDLIAIFENIPGKRILRAVVMGEHEREIAGFSTIPFQKRNFLVGISPQQREFKELTKSIKWAEKKSFYHGETDEIFHFCETKTGFFTAGVNDQVGDLRVITVWKEEESSPSWAVLTNQEKGAGEDLLRSYMVQCPYLGEAFQADSGLVLSSDEQEEENCENKTGKGKNRDIFTDLVETLHGHCLKYFFPAPYSRIDIRYLIANIYGIPGSCWKTEDSLKVFLDVEKNSVYRKDLEYAVKRVNERCVRDYLGRKLWLEI